MSCERYQQALKAAALGASRERGFGEHLDGCWACRTALENAAAAIARMDSDLTALLSVSPAPDFAARVTTGALAAPVQYAWLRWTAPAAACAVLIMAVTALVGVHERRNRVPALGVSGPGEIVASPPQPNAQVEAVVDAHDTARGGIVVSAPLRTGGRRPARRSKAASADVGPEVIVQPGQLRAVQRLITAVAEGRLTQAEWPGPAAEPAVVPVRVQPILISDIDGAGAVATAPSSGR